MKVISKAEAAQKIRETKGQIFSAFFIKKDGSERMMNCRLHVKKGVTGQGMAYNPADHGLINVFSMTDDGFRMINLKTLKSIQINKTTYIVSQ